MLCIFSQINVRMVFTTPNIYCRTFFATFSHLLTDVIHIIFFKKELLININTREIINRIPPLLETIEEGIDASITMPENLKLEESVSMLSNVYLGVQAV